MAHAIRGGESRRHSVILSKAVLFWAMFALLGIGGSYTIDHSVGPSADLASLALPSDAALEGGWVSGPVHLQSIRRGQTMIVELWRDRPQHRQIATFLLQRGAPEGAFGLRHRFASPDGSVALSLIGRTLMLEMAPKDAGRQARRLVFSRR